MGEAATPPTPPEHGLLELGDPGSALEFGAARGAPAATTPGDTSTARLTEIRRVVQHGREGVPR